MSSSTTISRALMALSLTFTFGLVTSAAAVEAGTGAPFSAASDPQVGYTPGTLATLLPIEVRVLVGGGTVLLAGDCHAAQVGTNPLNRRLVCPGLGAAPMTLVKQSPRLTYDVNLHGFVLAPGLAGEFRGAVLLDDDDYETMPVVATSDWFWGLHCELEPSDYQDCDNFCDGLNASVESVDTAIKDGACLALCSCITAGGAELGPVIADTDAP